MKARIISTVSAVVVSFAVLTAAIFMPPASGRNINAATASKASDTQTGYWLKEYQGKIGVFENNKKAPQQVLNVYIESLPEEDKELLRSGIKVKTHEELLELIENYAS